MVAEEKPDITVIILTFNEELHIRRCVTNAFLFAKQVFIIDSYSTDKTVEIAESLGAIILKNKWENNHAKQVNWALENCPFTTDWILRLDADEFLTEKLIEEIKAKIPNLPVDISGVVLPRQIYFLGQRIKRGTSVVKILRLFKNKKAKCEDRLMDEHMVLLEGSAVEFSNFMIDNNLSNLGWWTAKHNGYSLREAIDLLNQKHSFLKTESDKVENKLTRQAKKKRKAKSLYSKMPLFLRAFLYFIYRYFIMGGFLDGRTGLIWHFLQGFWYRFLVDAKIYEIQKLARTKNKSIVEVLEDDYGFKIN